MSISLDDHLQKTSPEIRKLYNDLHERICELGEDIEGPVSTKPYLGYKKILEKKRRNFVEVHIQKERIKLHLLPAEYNDPEIVKVAKKHKWTLDHTCFLSIEGQLDKRMGWIKQSYEKTKSLSRK